VRVSSALSMFFFSNPLTLPSLSES
jgi:hypothetical protein